METKRKKNIALKNLDDNKIKISLYQITERESRKVPIHINPRVMEFIIVRKVLFLIENISYVFAETSTLKQNMILNIVSPYRSV